MVPLEYMANEGRANPKGIPYLYLATSKETAMSEVRPWIGSEISVSQFRVTHNLTIVDCSLNHSSNPLFYRSGTGFYEPEGTKREQAVWAHIDKAFSEPIVPNDNQAHYVATQIISELFKSHGLDGLLYKSMLGDDYNIVLFDMKSTKILNCSLYEAENVSFAFTEICNPHFFSETENTKGNGVRSCNPTFLNYAQTHGQTTSH
jgi:hypothetical protein